MRSLARGFAALILLLPVNSYALGLGEIELHSALNQPLDAEISLLSADSVNPKELNVELASSDSFAQANLDRPVFLTKIKFEVDHKSDGRLYIKLTSKDSIKEPFLDFLVEVNWPNGRLMREYTVLLDPPVLLNDKPAPIEPAQASTGSSQDQNAPSDGKMSDTTSVASRPTPPVRQARSSAGGLEYGPVTRTDTLWSIASDMKPDQSVTVQQVMMALLKSNPEAFYNNNINALKAGYVLRISDPDLITAMSAEQALKESRLQYQQWLDAKRNAGQAAGQRAIGSQAASSAGQGASTGETGGAKLKLVAPGATEGSSTTSGLQSGSKGLESLREELAVALETSDVTRQENEELRNRITALEEKLASMQRLVTLKDDTMAAIQGSEAQPEPEAQPEEMAEEAPAPEINVPETTQQPVAPPPKAAPPKTPPQPRAAPAPPPPAKESVLSSMLKDPMVLLPGAGIIVILIALLWMKMRQRQLASDGFEEGILAAAEQVADESDSAIASAVGGYTAESAMDAIETDSDEMDVLAEADVYLAYRRFDKAIELLNGALQNEPDRSDYKVKLLEVYSESEDIDGFVAQAEQLYATIGPQGGPVWDRVVQMGRKLTPDHPLFSGADSGAGDTAGTMADTDDGSLAADFPEASESTDVENEIDLEMPDLDEDLPGDTAGQEAEESTDSIFADSFEDSENVAADVAESPDTQADDDLAASFSMDDEPKSESAESEMSDIVSDEVTGGSADDDALSFDLGDEAGTSEEPAAEDAMEGLSFDTTTDTESEETITKDEETVTEDTSNVINFEAEVSPQTEPEETQEQPQDATPEVEAGDFGNAIEFESGLAPPVEQPSEEDKEQDVAADEASGDSENVMEFDLDTMGEEEAAAEEDSTAVPSVQEDELDELSAAESSAVQEQPEDNQEPQETRDTEDTSSEMDDDLDWLSNIDDDLSLDDDSLEDSESDDNLITGGDEVGTKLDLAKAYIDMDDKESARGILDEVVQEGNEEQKREAEELKQQLG